MTTHEHMESTISSEAMIEGQEWVKNFRLITSADILLVISSGVQNVVIIKADVIVCPSCAQFGKCYII